jgi:molybdenum cofactor biosynthesis protein B
MTSPSKQHRAASKDLTVRAAVITLSDTRTKTDDKSGALIQSHLKSDGHAIIDYEVLRDEPDDLKRMLTRLIEREDVDVIITTGGTGISRRDCTIAVTEKLLTAPLPGFGEIFRMLSWEQVGSSAMLSRACAGVMSNRLIFCLPGSVKAVELAMTKLILPEIRHLVWELRHKV